MRLINIKVFIFTFSFFESTEITQKDLQPGSPIKCKYDNKKWFDYTKQTPTPERHFKDIVKCCLYGYLDFYRFISQIYSYLSHTKPCQTVAYAQEILIALVKEI